MTMRTLASVLSCTMRCGVATAASAQANATQRSTTLREAYRGTFLIGTAVNEAIVSGSDAAMRDLAVQHFNTVTAENVMKAGPLNPSPGVWNWLPADAFVAFGENHKMFIVGHTLVWHNQTPSWFFTDTSGTPRPGGRICSWTLTALPGARADGEVSVADLLPWSNRVRTPPTARAGRTGPGTPGCR